MRRSVLAAGLILWALASGPAAAGEQGTVVLDSSGFWRVHCALRTPLVGRAGDVKELDHKVETALPPGGWEKPDFDDTSWRRLRGHPFPFCRYTYMDMAKQHLGPVYYQDGSAAVALICMRGAFNVTDPGRAGRLTLDIAYRGGVVAYLNGTEVARGHLAKDARALLAVADDYPVEASLDASGKPLKTDKKTLERLAKRTRRISAVEVPGQLLRKGRNVLALEIHRAAFAPEAVEKIMKEKYKHYVIWGTCDLVSARLETAATSGVEANVVRPRGLQAWNSDALSPDFDLDFGCRAEKLRPIRIVGARNGAFGGKVVLGSDQAIKGLGAKMSDLERTGGAGRIAASSVQVRFAMPTGSQTGASGHYPAPPTRFDALLDAPPAEVPVRSKKKTRDNWVRPGQPEEVFGAVVPVWVTVNVPADAAPGEYEGTLTIRAGAGGPVNVPVKLEVCGWKLPEPRDFRTYVELIQSPDTVAMKYEVEPWSDEHFKLMGRSFRLMGQVGNKTLYVPLISQTNLGNPESMVRWVKCTGGGYSYDLSVMKKYLDLAEEHQGKPTMVCLYVWDVFLEGGFLRYAKTGRYARPDIHGALARFQGKGPRVTLVETGSGKTSELQLPLYSEPEGSAPHWAKLFAAVRAEMKSRGLEKAMALGVPNDSEPTKEVVEFFAKVAPGIPWIRQAHSSRKNLHGAPYSYQCLVWSPRFNVYPDVESKLGWKRPDTFLQFARNVTDSYPITTFRLIGEMNIIGGQRGFGRLGADFWRVLADKRGRVTGTLCNRWPHVDWRNLTVKTSLLAPGPDGAVATARFEMLREGVQECEARIFIERELESGRMGGALAGRCRKILHERSKAILLGLANHHTTGFEKTNRHGWWNTPGQVGAQWYISSGWRERSGELYRAAAEAGSR